MGHLHEMLIEDEIIMCGTVMLAGILTGIVSRVVYAIRQRRAAGSHRPHTPA
jgi:hypothetical protein